MQNEVRVRDNTGHRTGRQGLHHEHINKPIVRSARPRKVESPMLDRNESAGDDFGVRQLNKRFAVSQKGRVAARHTNTRKPLRAARRKSGPLVTEKVSSKSPFPIFAIATCFVVTAVFMYILSLYVKLDDYNADISSMQNQIAELGEQATVLEVSIERKFNLDMVEKIATEEYGMVSVDGLPKSYVSVSGEDEYGTESSADGKTEEKSSVPSSISELNIE